MATSNNTMQQFGDYLQLAGDLLSGEDRTAAINDAQAQAAAAQAEADALRAYQAGQAETLSTAATIGLPVLLIGGAALIWAMTRR